MWACQGFSAGVLSVEAGAERRVGGGAIFVGDVRFVGLGVPMMALALGIGSEVEV